MPVNTRCPNCHKPGQSPATYVGMRARCGSCYYEFEIVAAEGFVGAAPRSKSGPARSTSGPWGFRASVKRMGARLPKAWK